MSDFTSIAGVAESIRKLLQNEMDKVFRDTVSVTLDPPKKIQEDNRTDNRLLSVYLYKVMENPDLKNAGYIINNRTEMVRTTALDIHFIATPYGPDQDSILRIAGRTQQVLCSKIITGSLLQSTIEGSDQSIKITQIPLPQELITQIWQAMEVSMRMSFYYIATPVYIDLESIVKSEPVQERQIGRQEEML